MGRILGIDYGDSRIGLAISDQNQKIAFPFKTVKNKDENWIIKFFDSLILEKEIDYFVLGLPIGMNGKDTMQTTKVRAFAQRLETLKLPIYLQDERLTSVSAKKSLIKENIKTGHMKEKIDERAASILLQQFIDYTKNFNGSIK